MLKIPTNSTALRSSAGYAGFFLAFVFGAELGRTLSISPTFATFWPPSGIYLAALLIAGRRRDRLTIAVAVAANLSTDWLLHGRAFSTSLGFCLANTVEALLTATILRKFGVPFAIDQLRNVAALAIAAGVIGPAVGATFGATLVASVFGGPFDSTWIIWTTADALGALLFAPPILLMFKPGQWSNLRRISPWRVVEFCVVLCLLTTAVNYIFGIRDRPLPLITLPWLLWIAVRFDVNGVPISNLILATITVGYAHLGRGPFSDLFSLHEQLVCAQAALSIISLSFLAMAGLVAERRGTAEILAESEMRFRLLVQETTEYAICMLDTAGNVATWNVGAARITGWYESEIVGRSAACFYGGGEVSANSLRDALTVARTFGRYVDEGWRYNKAGSPFWAGVVLTAIYDQRGELRGYSQIVRDRTEPRLREVELETTRALLEDATLKFRNLAHTDSLTQLFNRRGFFDEFDAELARSARHAVPFSLLLLDVDHFKSFNDTFGHSAGDEVLKSVATLLAENVRGTDVVGRYGGEEFIVLLPTTDVEGALGVAERLREAVASAPWTDRSITLSVGAATLDPSAENGLRLIEEADRSLYASKEAGRNRSTHFLELADREVAV